MDCGGKESYINDLNNLSKNYILFIIVKNQEEIACMKNKLYKC